MKHIDKYNSQKITVLNTISIYFVLVAHSAFTGTEGMNIASVLISTMGVWGLGCFAVPMFYAISGLLFFKGMETVKECYPKIKKRLTSLLVPYVIWNFIFLLWYIILANLPVVSKFITSDVLTKMVGMTLYEKLYYIFLEPVAFHLWFLRDLIIYVFLSPFLFICIKKYPRLTLCLFFILTSWMTRCGLFFFVFGGIVGVNMKFNDLDKINNYIIIGWILFLIHCFVIVPFKPFGRFIWEYYMTIINTISIIIIWRSYDLIIKDYNTFIELLVKYVAPYTFFIYLFHEPILNIVKKGLMILGDSESLIVFVYLVSPVLIMFISIIAAVVIKKMFSPFYSLIIGGRY